MASCSNNLNGASLQTPRLFVCHQIHFISNCITSTAVVASSNAVAQWLNVPAKLAVRLAIAPTKSRVFPLFTFFLLWPCGRLMDVGLLERSSPEKKRIDLG